MKVLVSSYACNPVWGSESAVGWRAVCALASRYEVWVMTHAENRREIEKTIEEVSPNLHFVYFGSSMNYSENRLIARVQSWLEYLRWNAGIVDIAESLHRAQNFDVCHHITFLSWRTSSPLARMGLPFIWGPIGGGEAFPWPLAGELSLSSRFFEIMRELSNIFSRCSGSVRRCGKSAKYVFAANQDTAKALLSVGVGESRIGILCGVFFDQNAIKRFGYNPKKSVKTEPLRIFVGGNLEGRKGIALALRALKKVKDAGVEFRYIVGGNGGERQHLQELARRLGIENDVVFSEGFNGKEYVDILWETDILLLPSLRDSASMTLMEGMLCEAVPVVLNCGGPSEIVCSEIGIVVQPRTVSFVVNEIAKGLLFLASDRKRLNSWGKLNRNRILENYTRQNYLTRISDAYLRM